MNKSIVYIIHSERFNVFYEGVTQNLEKRILDHNTKKSTYTKGKEPWILVFTKTFELKSEALKFEKMLKRQNRNYLDWLIKSDRNEIG